VAEVVPLNPPDAGPTLDPTLKGLIDKIAGSTDTLRSNVIPIRRQQEQIEKKIEALPTPAVPELQPTPQNVPTAAFHDPMKEMSNPLMLLGILGGALTHTPITAALNNGASFLEGLQKGDQQATKERYDEFNTHLDAALKANGERMQAYNLAADNYKNDIGKMMQEWKSVATRYGDPITMEAIETGNMQVAANLLNAAQRQQEMVEIQRMRLQGAALGAPQIITSKDGTQHVAQQDKMGLLGPPGAWYSADEKRTPITDVAQVGALSSAIPPQNEASRWATASMLANGVPPSIAVPGWGTMGALERDRARQDAVALLMRDNPQMTPEQAGIQMANNLNNWQGGRGATVLMTRMLGTVRAAVSQLDYNLDQAQKAMDKLPSSNIAPVLNAIYRGEERWTGDPAYSQLFFFMTAATQEAARIMSGGTASVAQLREGAREEAKKWLDQNWTTPNQFAALRQSMHGEAENRIQNWQEAISATQVPGGPAAVAPQAPVPSNEGGSWLFNK